MRYFADGRDAVQPPESLNVGDQMKLADSDMRRWWTVQAVSEHFAACVQQEPFAPKGVLRYTVLDWRNGVRGPCDLIGQGYGDGSYSEAECAQMLADFEFDEDNDPARLAAVARGENSWVPTGHRLRVSQRNWVRLVVVSHRAVSVR